MPGLWLPSVPVLHIADLRHRELEPCGLFRFAVQCTFAQGVEHSTHGIRAGWRAHVDGLWVQAGGNGGQKRPLRGLVQLLCLVKDQQVAVLAASAVAGAGQKLDAGTAFQDDLLPTKCSLDLSYMAAQLRAFKKCPHFLKGLGGGLLQVGGVNDCLIEQQHPGFGASLHQQTLAVLAGDTAARRGRCPFAGHCALIQSSRISLCHGSSTVPPARRMRTASCPSVAGYSGAIRADGS